jgi:hypothetical protein
VYGADLHRTTFGRCVIVLSPNALAASSRTESVEDITLGIADAVVINAESGLPARPEPLALPWGK